MKLSLHSLRSPFAGLAILVSSLSFVQDASAAQPSTPTGPTVIPGGAVNTTYVITASGSYVLGGNRTMNDCSKNAIEIKAPDVTLDLGGYTLAHGIVGNPGLGALVYIPATENVEIRNGTLANAAKQGVRALAGKGLRTIDLRIVSADYTGIESHASGAVIDRCQVADTKQGILAIGAGTLITDCVVSACSTVGISVPYGSRIVRSVAQGCATGLNVQGGSTASDCTVTGSSLKGISAMSSTLRNVDVTGNAIGVSCDLEYPVFITGSRISGNSQTSVHGGYLPGVGNCIQ